MGTWGPGLFSDDTAADVREVWRDALMDGLDDDAATQRVRDELRAVFEDVDDAVVGWLALAAAQMQTGRLQPSVRDRALEIIEKGGDVGRWKEEASAALARRREKALEQLKEKLQGPQPAPKTLRRPKPRLSPLEVGDVVRLRGARRGEALFVVVDIADTYPPGSTAPVVAGLLWEGKAIPDLESLTRLPLLHDAVPPPMNPDRVPPPRLQLHIVDSPTRGKYALANVGEVVANGVLRPDAGDHRRDRSRGFADGPEVGYCTWLFLSAWIGETWHQRCIEVTRRMV